ncbi:MAG TPA: 23S rRNA (pseudouridine(1915)-N(3))-methyltransferase RlmH [Gemmatimonadaceae bacterium]|nr:23S rRNA (pseudouridine(1915)-N(3))-methyltransferase RlmH [Gemmatimonadaceae bacterium]
MRVVVAVVGKPRNAALAAAIADYEKRAARYWPLDVHEVREERASSVTPALVREREGERLRERVVSARIVACDKDGKSFTSEEFAQWLQNERERERDVAFVIGGAFGLSDQILRDSAMKISLAPWTLPHELARLVLAEQLYRAGSILRNEPYHK